MEITVWERRFVCNSFNRANPVCTAHTRDWNNRSSLTQEEVERIIVVVQVVLERLNQQNHRGNHFLIFIFYFAVDFACNIVRGIIEMILAYNYVSSRRVAAENKTKFSVICRCGFGFHLVLSTRLVVYKTRYSSIQKWLHFLLLASLSDIL